MENSDRFSLTTVAVLIISCVVSIASLYVSFNIMPLRKPNTVERSFLPNRYLISRFYDVPAKESVRTPSWAITAASYMESMFRKQGISLGKIKKDEYVEFYPEGIASKVNASVFNRNVYSNDFPLANLIESFLTKPNELSFLLTPKNNKEKDDIRMEIKSTKVATTVEAAKKLIVESERPLILSIQSLRSRYYYKCSPSDKECLNKGAPCPKHFGISAYCGNYSSSTFSLSGNFITPEFPAIPALSGRFLNFVVEGYNDDAVLPLGINQFSTQKKSVGAFIVRSLLSSNAGHSLDFLYGESDPHSSGKMCANNFDPEMWKTFSLDKKEKDQTFTELRCKDDTEKVCDSSHLYALLTDSSSDIGEASVAEDKNGITTTALIDLTELRMNNETKVKIVKNALFWDFGSYFEPINRIENGKECGHWLIPYDYIDKVRSIDRNGVFVSDYHFKFSSDSYNSGLEYSKMQPQRH